MSRIFYKYILVDMTDKLSYIGCMGFASTELPTFIRSVREAQGISQKDLAEKISVTPSAITQYEKSLASISKEKLLAVAPILNLNPDFISTGIGNPFKSSGKDGIIKLFFPLKPDGKIDLFSILHIICDYSSHAVFVFLKPSSSIEQKSLRIKRWQRKGLNSFALIIRDSDNNLFILKRRDDIFFKESEIITEFEHFARMRHKVFAFHVVLADDKTFRQIEKWNIKKAALDTLLSQYESANTRNFLYELLKQAKKFDPSMTEKEYEELQNRIEDNRRPRDSVILSDLMPKINELLKDLFPIE